MMNKKAYSDPDLQVCRFEQSDAIGNTDTSSKDDTVLDYED